MITHKTQRRIARIILRAPGKECWLALFGCSSFVLGATLATVNHGAFYLMMLWALAVGILVMSWRD